MPREIQCFNCKKTLANLANGSFILKEGFRSYCLDCENEKTKPTDFSSLFNSFGRKFG